MFKNVEKIRFVFVIAIFIIAISAFTLTSFAETTNQVRPNYTAEDAQLMQRNAETPEQYYAINTTQEHVISGSLLSDSEEDWYKISLSADPTGNNTLLSINCKYLKAQVLDINQNVIFEQDYIKSANHMGARSYRVSIPTAGYYYIRLSDSLSTDGSYLMTMGGPNYAMGNFVFTGTQPLTLSTSKTTAETICDLSSVDVPEGAIVYSVTIGGTKTGSCTSETRSIRYATESSFLSSKSSVWDATIALSLNKFVANRWTVRVSGTSTKSDYSLTPKLTFRYVYPCLPEVF
ncbi:hypothetical protein FACS1894120_5370 [Clostridia bacterium]|nr:hypothetical protein FACS1894120_5370 [Clostridia bacterium]